MYLCIIYVFLLHNEIRSITKTLILRAVKETSKYSFYILIIINIIIIVLLTNSHFQEMSDTQISLGKM